MRYTIKHTVNTDVETFWNRLFLDEAFNRALFVDFLGYVAFSLQHEAPAADGTIVRRLDATPKNELPELAKKLLGVKALAISEQGTFDPTARKYVGHASVIGSKKLAVDYELFAEPRGDKTCERVAVIQDTVKVPGLGTLIEAAIQKATRENYDLSANFSNRWLEQQGL